VHTSSDVCASCHLSRRPPTHLADPVKYPTTCEICHAYPTWTFTHTTSSSANCYSCHSGAAPSAHLSYASSFGTLCQNCHTYPSWLPGRINHSLFGSFPTSHHASRCSDCHPSQNYGNSGGCIECHSSRGVKVHHTSTNSGCLRCHPDGRK